MSEKILTHHLSRRAVLYVRQSTPQQVAHNRESRELQYAMQGRLHELGWHDVEVIDEDLGRSAAGSTTRSGFEGMLAQVSLGEVGVVAAWEVSRFARNSPEWQQLIEICRVVDTILVDQETVYTPRQTNDRLLLGLKGSLNEYELDLLRERSLQARHEKARRGELIVAAPVGYRKTEDQKLEKEPDQRIQRAIELIFEKFFEIGSVRQTLMWFLEHGLEVPALKRTGETYWRRPGYPSIHRILTNPAYGGAYAYGKTVAEPVYEQGRRRSRMRSQPREQWLALIPETHEGYISWEQHERIQRMIAQNVCGSGGGGAAKHGAALLGRLLRCRRCGRKLTVQYTGPKKDNLRYSCVRARLDNGAPNCIAFGGTKLDIAVSHEVLRVIEPGAIEAAVHAAGQVTEEQDRVLQALEHDLEAADYRAQRAFKQFDSADPDNRLVVDELERRWNVALQHVQDLEGRVSAHKIQLNSRPSATSKDFIALSEDVERLWHDPATDMRLKKRIVRTLIQEIVADIDEDANEVVLVIHWHGGIHTELRERRRRRGECFHHTAKEVVEVVRVLVRTCPDAVIAGMLTRNGLRTGRGNRWTRERVTSLRSYHKIPRYCANVKRVEGWMNLTEAAEHLGITPRTLRLATQRGEVDAEHPLPDGPWIFNRRALEDVAAVRLVERARQRVRPAAIPQAGQQDLDFSST